MRSLLSSLEEDIADYGYEYSDEEGEPESQTPTLVAAGFHRVTGEVAPEWQVGQEGGVKKIVGAVQGAAGVDAGMLEVGVEMDGGRLGEKRVVGDVKQEEGQTDGSEDPVVAAANHFWSAPAEYLAVFQKR